jgi:NAD(P)-dependent dehydrogenase (short-subunit alcohol dehydrogenase family)
MEKSSSASELHLRNIPMDVNYTGKVIVITGASRGIGLAIARSVAKAGASLAICARSQAGVDQAVQELSEITKAQVIGQAVDVGDSGSVKRFFQAVDECFNGVDVLVNNAGVGVFRPVADLTVEDWQVTLNTNLNGVFYCSREALPLMRKRGGGYVINISSLAGKNAFAGGAAYNASKFALNGFSEAMMLDHRYDNIRVSYIMPGSVDTDFGRGAKGSSWKIAAEDVAAVVMGLLSMPERTTVSRVEMRPSKPAK